MIQTQVADAVDVLKPSMPDFRLVDKDFCGLACGLKWRGLKEELA